MIQTLAVRQIFNSGPHVPKTETYKEVGRAKDIFMYPNMKIGTLSQ